MPYAMIEPVRDLLYSSMQGDHLEVDKRGCACWRSSAGAEVELTPSSGIRR